MAILLSLNVEKPSIISLVIPHHQEELRQWPLLERLMLARRPCLPNLILNPLQTFQSSRKDNHRPVFLLRAHNSSLVVLALRMATCLRIARQVAVWCSRNHSQNIFHSPPTSAALSHSLSESTRANHLHNRFHMALATGQFPIVAPHPA